MATAYFMQQIIEMTDVNTDQEHIEMIVYNDPKTPDRTRYILGLSDENPAEEMISAGKKLKLLEVDTLAIPCITAHFFHSRMEEEIGLPIIHGVRETARYLKERGIRTAGLMATDGTVKSATFQNELESEGIKLITPDKDYQKLVMSLIYDNIKAGKRADMGNFAKVSAHLRERGADVIILGCTELSIIKRDENIGPGYIDALDVLAQKCVVNCGKLRPEFKELITK